MCPTAEIGRQIVKGYGRLEGGGGSGGSVAKGLNWRSKTLPTGPDVKPSLTQDDDALLQ